MKSSLRQGELDRGHLSLEPQVLVHRIGGINFGEVKPDTGQGGDHIG
jgi:hypothetical protein